MEDYLNLRGLKALESPNAIKFVDVEITVPRSWRERLFSWPWKPWVTTKKVTAKETRPAMYQIGTILLYHPALKDSIFRKDG